MSNIESNTDRLYSVTTLAELLDVSRATVWRWVKDGDAPPLHRITPRATRGRSSEWNPYIADPAAWLAEHQREREAA